MKIPPEKLSDPMAEKILPYKIARMKDEQQRDETLLEIAYSHIFIAIECLNAIFTPQEHLSQLLQQEAHRQAQRFGSFEQANRAFSALFKSEQHTSIKTALASIGKPNAIHRQLIRQLMSDPNLESVRHWLTILFENYRDSLSYRQYTPTLPSHTLWLWALQDIPADWGLNQHEERDILAFYRFFVQQTDYSAALNLLPEKFPELNNAFNTILQTENNAIWLRRVYEEKIKHHPEQLDAYLAEMHANGVSLDEISYNTLINKAQSYQQGIELFEDMKSNGLKPNVITFTTLFKKATKDKQPLQVILDLLDEMISLKIKPSTRTCFNKKGKKLKPHTIYAVQDKLRRSQKPYRAWVHQKREQLQNQPHWLQTEWEEIFIKTLK
jgi:pentatricopeptide repeat protein